MACIQMLSQDMIMGDYIRNEDHLWTHKDSQEDCTLLLHPPLRLGIQGNMHVQCCEHYNTYTSPYTIRLKQYVEGR